ncbi:MAG: hypothetical protein LUG24_01485 [Clostridiales bacterium]|nr:hypothetical protein [Clostridiales bacterium]
MDSLTEMVLDCYEHKGLETLSSDIDTEEDFNNTVDKLISAHIEKNDLKKYYSDFTSAAEGSAVCEYYSRLNDVINSVFESIRSVSFEDLTKVHTDGLSSETEAWLNAAEPPWEALFMKYLMLEACGLVSEVEELPAESGLDSAQYPEADGYETYIEYCCLYGEGVKMFQIITNEFD